MLHNLFPLGAKYTPDPKYFKPGTDFGRFNPNLLFLHEAYACKCSGASLEGSSRSAKTWSSIDFIIYICSANPNAGLTINIIKETAASFKTTLYDDFNRRLPMFGIKSPFADREHVQSFTLYGNRVNLLGADDESKFHGAGCDFAYFNEVLDISNAVFDQVEQRCRKFWWADYNPKATDHWWFKKTDNRKDVAHLKTTFADNPHISEPERRKILSYQPTPDNISAGTADDYMWNVYGLGLRSAPEGLIFQHVTWIKEWPANMANILFGLDFGYTNSPSVLTKVAIRKNELYAQKLFYAPTPSTNELEPALRMHCKNEEAIWADPSGEDGGRGMISQLRRLGYNVFATNTYPGSIKSGISIMKKYKIHLIDDVDVRKEQSNYKFRIIHGIKLDEPVDAFNHFWDSVRMPVMSNYK